MSLFIEIVSWFYVEMFADRVPKTLTMQLLVGRMRLDPKIDSQQNTAISVKEKSCCLMYISSRKAFDLFRDTFPEQVAAHVHADSVDYLTISSPFRWFVQHHLVQPSNLLAVSKPADT